MIVYVDAFGVRPAMHAIAERVASLGYAVLLPDVFHEGAVQPFDAATVWSDPPERDRLMALIHSLTAARVERDGGAFLDALAAAHLEYRIELYRGEKHGFAVSDHPVHDADAERRHWRRLESFLGETLG